MSREHGRCLIKLVAAQQTLSITWAEGTKWILRERQTMTSECVGIVDVSRGRTREQRGLVHVRQGFWHQHIARQQSGIALREEKKSYYPQGISSKLHSRT